MQISRSTGSFLILFGCCILTVNLIGGVSGMRVAEQIPVSKLRFENDLTLSYEETINELERVDNESDFEYASRATKAIQGGVAHLNHWNEHQPDQYSQRVPFGENYILHVLGRFSGMPQLQRYHFTDYRRSLERGIGLCGDHALILSQVLQREGIDSTILSFPTGHVVLEVRDSSGKSSVFDSDFGVILSGVGRYDLADRQLIEKTYAAAGYSAKEIRTLVNVYASPFSTFGNTFEFMRKRYVFERISYVLKWLVPILFVAGGLYLFSYSARAAAQASKP